MTAELGSAAASAQVSERLWSWSVPTPLVAGPGALQAACAETASFARRAALLADPSVRRRTELVERVRRILALGGVSTEVVDGSGSEPELTEVVAVRDRLRAIRADVVVAIGGGACMDTAKAAALSLRNPWLLESDAELWRSQRGLVAPGGEVRRSLPVVAVPTTLGTGSEMTPVCSLRQTAGKKLLVHQWLWPRLAVLDPACTRTLPRQLILAGAFEAWSRVFVPAVTGEEQPLQDALAIAVGRTLIEAGDAALESEDVPDEVRLQIALASAHSHSGWSQLARSPYGHVLWYLASEVAPYLEVTKVAALASLTPAWLRSVISRSWHLRLGDAGRLARMAGGIFSEPGESADLPLPSASSRIERLLERWSLPTSLSQLGGRPDSIPSLTARTVAAWGGEQPMLGYLAADDLAHFYQSALAPNPPAGEAG